MDIDFTKRNNQDTEALAEEIRQHCNKVLKEKAKQEGGEKYVRLDEIPLRKGVRGLRILQPR